MAQPLPPLSAGAVQAIADGAPDIKAVVQIIDFKGSTSAFVPNLLKERPEGAGSVKFLSDFQATSRQLREGFVIWTGVKPVPNKGEGKQRHRLALCDGQHWITSIPATQLDHLVTNQVVHVGSVIRLQEYLFNQVNSRQVLILLNFEILGKLETMADGTEVGKGPTAGGNMAAPLLGAAGPGPYAAINGTGQTFGGTGAGYGGPPTGAGGYGGPPAGNGYAIGIAPPAAGPYGGPPASGGYGGPPAYGGGPPQPGAGAYGSGSGYGSTGGYGAGSNAGGGYGGYGGGGGGGYGQNAQYRGTGPIARNEAPPRIVPINSLNSYQSHWTIKARITQKSEIRRYSNARGEGKLFSFELLDAQGGEIRGCAFNQCVDKFEPLMQQGAVIMMSKASLKNRKKDSGFNNTRHDYEITLEPGTVIEPCDEEEAVIPKMQYHFTKIKQVNDIMPNNTVDVMGIVDRVEPSAIIQTRDSRELMKRNVSIRDDSGASVEITLWGSYASDPGDQLEESFNNGVHSVLALKNAKVGEFNGRTLSTVSQTTVTVDPDVPEAGHLRHWYDSAGGAAAPVSALTGGGQSSGGGKFDRRCTLAHIKEENIGANGTAAWVQVNCTITFVKSDPIAYPACTLQFNGKPCNKKVTDSTGSDGPNRWWCERCSAPCEAEWRYMLSLNIEDHSGKEWVTAFQDEAKLIVGYTANEMQELKDAESPLFEARLNDIKCRSYLFKLKVSEETWNDEQRIRINVSRVDAVDFVKESKQLLDYITKLQLNQPVMPPQPPAGSGSSGYGGARTPGAPVGGGAYGGGGGGVPYGGYGAGPTPQTLTYGAPQGGSSFGGPPARSPGGFGGGYNGGGGRGGAGGGSYGGGGYGNAPPQQAQGGGYGGAGGSYGAYGNQQTSYGGGGYQGPGGF